ncbi:MAG TPA: OsmC family protein [Longimicrobiales bacterium]
MADTVVNLRWTGDGLRFEGGADTAAVVPVDGGGEAGARPTELLLLGLAGCMGVDIVDILGKMRVPLEGLDIRVEGDRAAEPPRRFVRIRILCDVRGVSDADEAKLQRAIALSKEKYCSVLHTLRPDCEIRTEARRH